HKPGARDRTQNAVEHDRGTRCKRPFFKYSMLISCQQRCWVHKTANILNELPKSKQGKVKAALQEIMPTSWPMPSPCTSALYCCYSGQASGGTRGSEKGGGHGGTEWIRETTMIKTAGVDAVAWDE
ncbi:hypothetical protein, partial [Acidithiobacillus sp.]|uniref:hypothetical protein n=1 Tax=Acidithiobacillus sp. TaxID=1872118 RepID=UPI00338ED1EC